MLLTATIFPLGDGALTVDFGNRIDEAVNRKVLWLFHRLQTLSPHINDFVPAYSSLTLYYDVPALRTKHQSAFTVVKSMLEPLLTEVESFNLAPGRQLRIPVCYAENHAPDLEQLATQKNLSAEDFIRLHTATAYRVYMIGFLPGFAYMGTVDDRIATPRKTRPRSHVPAGAVGIAGSQTGIYPLASPGGWNLVGQTPVTLFDATRKESVLFRPGDEVRFYSITEDEFANYQSGSF